MRLFSFLMAVVIIVITVMPCADAKAMYIKSSKYEIEKQQKDSKPFSDQCSPFCQCNCCAGFSINHSVVSLTKIPVFSNNPTSSFLPLEIIKVSLPIWQPPQL